MGTLELKLLWIVPAGKIGVGKIGVTALKSTERWNRRCSQVEKAIGSKIFGTCPTILGTNIRDY
ncbi:MAG: hypothetical protein L0312_04565, partial [Acidobacteria bacterium]|nr:hypothetical protein [Acidobacteriota bacterium]